MTETPNTPTRCAPQADNRLAALDTLAAILPAGRCEQLANLLTDDDVKTLRHLAKEGMGENTLRALTSDFSYLEGWCFAATGSPLPWPAPEALILKFIGHHLWDIAEKQKNSDHGMPASVAEALKMRGLLRSQGPHAPATVHRRLSSWATLHRWRGQDGVFNTPGIRAALRLAVRTADRPRQRKSKKAITAEILEHMLATCDTNSLTGLRDRALLLVAFASGGRRRSEVASLRIDQLAEEEPVLTDPDDPDSLRLPCLSIRLGRTKTEDSEAENRVMLIGRPARALQVWLTAARIKQGALFPAIDRWGNLRKKAMTPETVNLIVKTRARQAGLDPKAFSAHGLRSGFLTETANRNIPLPDAMLQSRHKSVVQAATYYNEADRTRNRSARLLG